MDFDQEGSSPMSDSFQAMFGQGAQLDFGSIGNYGNTRHSEHVRGSKQMQN